MKNVFTAIVLMMILAACTPAVATSQSVDPNVQLAIAQAQLTSTSQAMQIQIVGWTATAQSWTATPSPVPTATLTPSVTPTPTIDVTMTLAVERMQAEIKDMERESERKDATNTFWAVIAPVTLVAFLLMAVVGAAYAAITYSRKQDLKVIERGNGDAPLLYSLSRQKAIDMDANANYRGGFEDSLMRAIFEHYLKVKFGMEPTMPVITADRQDTVKHLDQVTDLKTRTKVTNAALDRFMKEHALSQVPAPMPTAITAIANTKESDLFALPSWELVKGWDRDKDKLPVGNSNRGLEYWDLRNQAHLAVFGMTRSGKDRRLLRPLVTFMLASGQQVLMIGKETDFLPFMGHPNAVFVPVYDVTEREEAIKYAAALEACVAEKNSRIRHMAARGVSLWEYARTFIVLDELGNALLEMPGDLAESAMKKARSTVNEAGKAGMSLVFSAQRPKGFLDLTTQCGRVAFQVENDTEKGYALGIKNADSLPDIPTGYFYKKFRSLQVTGGFEPSDDDIRAYLNTVAVPSLPKADWIEGVVGGNQLEAREEPLQIIEPTTPESLPVKPVDEIAEMAERIRERWRPGMSGTHVATKLLGLSQYGGSLKTKTDKVIEYLTATTQTATTTENQPQMGILEPNPA